MLLIFFTLMQWPMPLSMKVIRFFTGVTSLLIPLLSKYKLDGIFVISDSRLSHEYRFNKAVLGYCGLCHDCIHGDPLLCDYCNGKLNECLSLYLEAGINGFGFGTFLTHVFIHVLSYHRVPLLVAIISLVLFLFFGFSLGLAFSSSLSVSDYTNEIIGTIGSYIRRLSLMINK